jgi:hypothetical protein
MTGFLLRDRRDRGGGCAGFSARLNPARHRQPATTFLVTSSARAIWLLVNPDRNISLILLMRCSSTFHPWLFLVLDPAIQISLVVEHFAADLDEARARSYLTQPFKMRV